MRHESEMLTSDQLLKQPMETLQRWKIELTNDTQSIQMQLTDLNKSDCDGNRLTVQEWNQWRVNAKIALRKKNEALRWVKHAITEKSKTERATPSPEKAIWKATLASLTKRLLAELGTVDFSGDEFTRVRELLSELRAHFEAKVLEGKAGAE